MILKSAKQIAEDIEKVAFNPNCLSIKSGDYWIEKYNGGIAISTGIAAHVAIKLKYIGYKGRKK